MQLEVEFTEEEIYDSLHGCDGDKAPGTDGFNLRFFQEYWGVAKQDILEFFMDFHKNSSL